jgi:hypothetical protein
MARLSRKPRETNKKSTQGEVNPVRDQILCSLRGLNVKRL